MRLITQLPCLPAPYPVGPNINVIPECKVVLVVVLSSLLFNEFPFLLSGATLTIRASPPPPPPPRRPPSPPHGRLLQPQTQGTASPSQGGRPHLTVVCCSHRHKARPALLKAAVPTSRSSAAATDTRHGQPLTRRPSPPHGRLLQPQTQGAASPSQGGRPNLTVVCCSHRHKARPALLKAAVPTSRSSAAATDTRHGQPF